jgi:diguanylate cyclase (GGDEF)-like protein
VSTTTPDCTLAEQLSRAFVLFGRLVAGAFIMTALAYGVGWTWLTPELERCRLAVRTEGGAHAAMLDEETGLRAYVMTGDTGFMEPYTRAERALAEANLTLVATVGTVPELAPAMMGTLLAEATWRDQWAKPVAGTRPATGGPSLADGKVLFDAYRRQETEFARVLDQRRDALSRREQRVIAARVVVELAVFIAVLLLAVRQHRALHAAIVVPVAALLNHIRRIRDGELEATAVRSGPHELAELAEGLNQLVGALVTARQSTVSSEESLRRHSLQLRLILDASREFSESLNLAYVVGAVRESTATVGGYEHVIVWLMDADQKRLINAEGSSMLAPADDLLAAPGHVLAERAAKAGRITFEGPDGQVHFRDGNVGSVQAIAIPLIVGARVVGALEARHAKARLATTQVIEVLETLATHAATAIESARLHEVVEERSQMDALTQLFNRHRLQLDLDAECKRSARYRRPLAFVMLDVDHFKAFNDEHGHPQADTALQQLAEVIAGCVRTTDTAYRYGGEEFCVLLRETCATDAMLFAERVRLRIEQRFTSGANAGITASFGVAGYSAETPTSQALVEAADVALYESKHAGRNRVVLSSSVPLALA